MAWRPLTSNDHGNDIVTITVGADEASSRTFTVHENLVCKNSDFFRKAFSSSYKEGNDGHMNLPDDWPECFEVFYGWLYSGQVEASDFYTNGAISPALFWVSVYIMANRLLTKEIQSIAFDRITEIFNDLTQVVPNPFFIQELFDHGSFDNLLEAYIIRHSAFWLTTTTHINSPEWEMALQAHERFGVGVAVQIAKVVSLDYKGSKLHPCLDSKFNDTTDVGTSGDDPLESPDCDSEISLHSFTRPPRALSAGLRGFGK